MSCAPIYCDYNAGAPIRAEAAVAVARALAEGGNASSVHRFGRRARARIEDAREALASLIDARAENIIFTSGATEALHLALAASGAASVIVSAVEHDALFEQAQRLRLPSLIAPVDTNGVINLEQMSALLSSATKPTLAVVQLANNETGVIQPISKVAALCREHGALLLVDAAQGLGRIPVNLSNLDATYLAVSSHKIGGPPGAGALVLAPGAPFVTTHFGGGQERGRRPGTENMPAIVGFAIAAEWAVREMSNESPRLEAMRDRFESKLPQEAMVFGARTTRLPNTSNFALPGMAAETAVIAFDLEGIALSSGAACSSGKVRASRILSAMGVATELARCALRVSFGHESKESDADAVLAALNKLATRRAQGAAA
jgi:cysteine desulfurase